MQKIDINVVTKYVNLWDFIGLLKIGAPKDEYKSEILKITKEMEDLEVLNEVNVGKIIFDVFTASFSKSVFRETEERCVVLAKGLLNNLS